jgi:galactitol-specific phosphotransferase system IIC component
MIAATSLPSMKKYARKKTKRQVLKGFDFIGLALLVGGLLILMGIFCGRSYYTWTSAHVIATIVIEIFALVIFVLYEGIVPLKEQYRSRNS